MSRKKAAPSFEVANPRRDDSDGGRYVPPSRDGRKGWTIYPPTEAFVAMHAARLSRVAQGMEASIGALIHEALDDWFERQGEKRHFGTKPPQ